jgi:Domain of unknown function (DUF4034)
MQMLRLRIHYLLLVALLSPLTACAQKVEPVLKRWDGSAISKDESTLQAYLVASRKADLEIDPLQRCLKFPNLPGTDWSKAHVQAHCNNHYKYLPELEKAKTLLKTEDYAALDALLNAAYARHNQKHAHDESVHHLLNQMSVQNGIGTNLLNWLRTRPNSVHAHALQSILHLDAADKARGERLARETTPLQFEKMQAFLVDAEISANKALSLSSDYAPAWDGLIRISKLGSDEALARRLEDHVYQKDELCAENARLMMNALEPRWGGSYEEMTRYAEELKRKAERNPLLRIPEFAPLVHAIRTEDIDEATIKRLMGEAIVYASNEDIMEFQSNWSILGKTIMAGEGRGWEYAMLQLQKMRFHDNDRNAALNVFEQLAKFDPAWAAKYGERGEQLIEGEHIHSFSPSYHYPQMSELHIKAGNLDKAESYMLKMQESGGALYTEFPDNNIRLLEMWLDADEKKYLQKRNKAAEHAKALITLHPRQQHAWAAYNRYLTVFPDTVVNKETLMLFQKVDYFSAIENDPEFAELKKRLDALSSEL